MPNPGIQLSYSDSLDQCNMVKKKIKIAIKMCYKLFV